MKLAATYKNNSDGAVSPELVAFLQQNLDDVNTLVRGMKPPAAVIVTGDGNTAFDSPSIRAHLEVAGVTEGELFRTCLKPPEDGYARVVYLAPFGSGAVDMLIENPDVIEPVVTPE